MKVIGLLSGTSMDAIDVAVAELAWDGDIVVLRPVSAGEQPFPPALRARLLAALPPNPTTAGELCELDTLLGQEFAAAVPDVGPDLVVSHGQTIFHWVEDGVARGGLQLGQPAWIAERTGLPVVSDLRARDIAAGGQGAPLASTLDVLWLRGSGTSTAALNLGGIANVTLVDADPPVAFDTGPGNCLLDVAATRVTGGAQTRDEDGRLARAGRVQDELLARLRAEPYFAAPAPKSTGRELFHAGWLDAALTEAVDDADLLATLTELTASTVADAVRAAGAARVVASGGGTRNPALWDALARHLPGVALVTTDELGLPSAGKEAFLFALLGFLTWHGVPGVLPGATGAAGPRVLGTITPGTAPLRLPPPVARASRLVIEEGSRCVPST